jgi:hypothetical protein
MEDIDVLLDFDSRYGFDETGSRVNGNQHQHQHYQHPHHQHHQHGSSSRYSSTLINHMPNAVSAISLSSPLSSLCVWASAILPPS